MIFVLKQNTPHTHQPTSSLIDQARSYASRDPAGEGPSSNPVIKSRKLEKKYKKYRAKIPTYIAIFTFVLEHPVEVKVLRGWRNVLKVR